MGKPENALQRACLEFLHLRGIMAWRNNSGAYKVGKRYIRFGTQGSGDIFAIVRGRFLSIECKVGRGKETADQKLWAAQVVDAGGVAIVARTVDDVADQPDLVTARPTSGMVDYVAFRKERTMELPVGTVQLIAQMCHEANRVYCQTLGEGTQASWDTAPSWQKESAVVGVAARMAQPDAPASDSHIGWLKQKEADGWVYGETKSADKKTHPCMVPYVNLPPEQQKKDAIFCAVCSAMFTVFIAR